MIDLDDVRWQGLKGGYKIAYDPRPALRRLLTDGPSEADWDELWEELHHQGDVDEASYACVPYLVKFISANPKPDWNPYGLIATIEIERHRKTNPELPDWLAASYDQAWADVVALALRDVQSSADSAATQAILGVVALAKGELELGAFISYSDSADIEEYLEDRDAWSSLYEG